MTTHDRSRRDRIEGVLLGLAAGDALGAGYEFGMPLDDDIPVLMNGGGPFNLEPGQWTDDTSMAMGIAIAMRDARQRNTSIDEALFDGIAAAWSAWAQDAFDIGNQTREIFHRAGVFTERHTTAGRLRVESQAFHDRTGQSAGNGSLMRTAPVALFSLDLPESGVVDLAVAISALTHAEISAGEGCSLWCLAVRHAIATGELDIRVGLSTLDDERRVYWQGIIEEAESFQPRDFRRNGWVVQALQVAWSAIVHTQADHDANHLVRALEAAVRGGRDTDTVAAIAGSLLGAAYGGSAVPHEWLTMLHGWPNDDAADLKAVAVAISPD